VLIAIASGYLAQSLGAAPWLALLVGSGALCLWFLFRTKALLVLVSEQQALPTLK
jgi:hypothetical protein